MGESKRVDLHTHTLASDGTTSPSENVRLAKEKGLAAIAITDHDTVAGVAEALEAARETGVEVIPGVEISSAANGRDFHVLGYFVPHEDEAFQARLKELRGVRRERNRRMIQRLQELGMDVTWEDVYGGKRGEDQNVGRPHIAEVLVKKGYVQTMAEAFDKYLGTDGLAYVAQERIQPQEAIRLIKQAGGVAVLAHPGLYNNHAFVEEMVAYGLDGLEVYHPDNSEEDVAFLKRLAQSYGLIVTAGSDFHGWREEKPYHALLGSYTTSCEAVEQMKRLANERRKK